LGNNFFIQTQNSYHELRQLIPVQNEILVTAECQHSCCSCRFKLKYVQWPSKRGSGYTTSRLS